MKSKIILRSLVLVFTTIYFSGCTSTSNISKGIIKDDFTVKFVDRNLELKPDVWFNTKELSLVENDYWNKQPVNYKITIEHGGKKYYGLIGFFNVPKKNERDAVASFYKISIPQGYFDRADDGSQACVYEYTKAGTATWQICLSIIPDGARWEALMLNGTSTSAPKKRTGAGWIILGIIGGILLISAAAGG